MSEADTPTNRNVPEPIAPSSSSESELLDSPANSSNVTDSSGSSTESEPDDWETVDFPYAISVNALSVENVEEEDKEFPSRKGPASSAPIRPFAPGDPIDSRPHTGGTPVSKGRATRKDSYSNAPEQSGMLIKQLRQRNEDLLNKVEQLESALHECRWSLQQQRSRAGEQQNLLDQRTRDLTAAQEQITHLFGELEYFSQEVQRQQIVMETLSAQFQSSQERLAQIERECALTQERCNEQSQLLLQSETACRELRNRLHRQQRHTLQFKAALEKCLEMPTKSSRAAIAPILDVPAIGSLPAIGAAEERSQPILPKAQPIKPWSAPPENPEEEQAVGNDESSEMIKAELINQSSYPTLPKAIAGDDGEGVELQETPIASNIDDLEEQPGVDPQEVPRDSTDEALERILPPPATEIDNLSWQDLEKLIDTPASPIHPDELPSLAPTLERRNTSGGRMKNDISLDTAALSLPFSEGGRTEDSLQAALSANNPPLSQETPPAPPTVAPPADGLGEEQQLATPTQAGEPTPAPGTSLPNWPAPVVYPLRSGPKRRSLAAVELPSFPQKNTQPVW